MNNQLWNADSRKKDLVKIRNNIQSWSCSGQDIFVLNKLNFKENGFFIELGGDDGVRKSNTLTLEENYNWNGIVIEACKEMYNKCLQSRKCIVLNDCIYSEETEIDFLDADGGPSGILGHDNKSENDKIIDRVGRTYKIEEKDGPVVLRKKTKTLNNILEENNAPQNIDYLSLDVEGAEYEILKNFSFNKWNIKILSIERPSHELKNLLFNNNYREICKLNQDVMFIRNV